MKTNPEDLKLLNAALVDESWHSFQSGLRAQTTAALHSTRRRRLVLSYTLQLAALVLVIAAWSALSFRSRNLSSPQNLPQLQANSQTPSAPISSATSSYITQDQMLALFPKDSCVLAEINGQTELVFFDTAHARNGFDLASN